MRTLLEIATSDRALLVAFAAGSLWAQWKQTRSSQRSQGERIGALEDRVSTLEGKAAK